MYIFIGLLLGSIVTSTHDSKEACLGRRDVLAEKGVTNGECRPAVTLTSCTYILTGAVCK